MITDSQGQEILEAIHGMSGRLDGMDGQLQGINDQLLGINDHLDKLEQTVGSLEERTGSLEQTVGSLVVEVAAQGQTLKSLVTHDEFNVFKDETLTHFDGLAGQIADLQEAETLRMTAH
jgi:archaellum component FlaC